jgi:hypothetical protein
MSRSLAELEAIVRNRICKVCTSRTVNGDCGLENPSSCALFQLFPQVARAIQSVASDDIQQYVDAIRLQVCSVCADQDSAGRCETRQQVQCALDAYLLLVVDAIEEATGKTFDRRKLHSAGGDLSGPGPLTRMSPQIQW